MTKTTTDYDPCGYESGDDCKPYGFAFNLMNCKKDWSAIWYSMLYESIAKSSVKNMANCPCYDSKTIGDEKSSPHYKGTRKRDREKSKHNWNNIFDLLNKLKDEFRISLPYKVVEVDGAEADDIIAIL